MPDISVAGGGLRTALRLGLTNKPGKTCLWSVIAAYAAGLAGLPVRR